MNTSYCMWVGDVWIQFEDGVKRREIPKRSGTARSWHENGELADEYEMVDGLVVGEHRDWHDNAVLAKRQPNATTMRSTPAGCRRPRQNP
jgi:hypothetical protein